MSDKMLKKFHEMEIDDRLLKAVAKLGWLEPTLIQERAIPLILEGKDVLLHARTGSGKTAAYAVPVIQKILKQKHLVNEQVTKSLVLGPTKELCHQIQNNFNELTVKCSREVTCVDISAQCELALQKQMLIGGPDIVIATPVRALAHLKAGSLNIRTSLEILVIDEADLIFSFGYEKDVKEIFKFLPKLYQAVLASATLSQHVLELKQLTLHNPVLLKLQEPELAPTSQLSHYHLAVEEEEKAVILYVLLKLNLVHGKTIVFVNSVDKCYRIKLFLEQFAIPSCVLNSELPGSMRCHSVSQFNQGVYDLIVASDEHALDDPQNPDPGKRNRRRDNESGVTRGIDFQFVGNIINFDFPKSINSYIHRVGRTARGNSDGTALSFVSVNERPLLNEVEQHLRTCLDTVEDQCVIRAYEFKLEEVEGFRYRARDAWKAVTKIAIREARLKEIKEEVLNSDKLKSYFEDNPRDLECLRHDKAFHTVKIQPHLANVPDYLVPASLKHVHRNSCAKRRRKIPTSASKGKFKTKSEDPLISLQLMRK